MNKAFVICGLGLILVGCANLERSRDTGDARVQGHTLAQQVCSNCHGLNGNPISPNFPRLASQRAAYIQSRLTQFRDHRQDDPGGFEYMWGISRSLTDEQIRQLGEYYAAQPVVAPPPTDEPGLDRGRRIFQEGVADASVPPCMSCHGSEAQGTDIAPRLAGQYADYLRKQLEVFQRTDKRPNASAMKVIVHGLTDADIRAVTGFIQNERPATP